MALWRRRTPKKVVVHSNRGSQYCSGPHRDLLSKHELLCSMSAKGNCYDNACPESFFHFLKVEVVHGESVFGALPERRCAASCSNTLKLTTIAPVGTVRRLYKPRNVRGSNDRLAPCPLLTGKIRSDDGRPNACFVFNEIFNKISLKIPQNRRESELAFSPSVCYQSLL